MPCCLRTAVAFFLLAGWNSARADAPGDKRENTGAPPVNYARDVRPILSDNCFACHGPDDRKRKAGLRFDTKDGAFAKLEGGSFAVVPGKPDESELVDRISSDDPDLKMPPRKSGKKLTAVQIAVLRRWVEQGAKTSTHWAFERPGNPRCRPSRMPAGPGARSTASSWPGSRPRDWRRHRRPSRPR